MSKRRQKTRAEPTQKRSAAFLCAPEAWDTLCCQGYTNLAHNPEIAAGVDAIARLIASMTLHLMRNTDHGDERVRDALSRKLDIDPCSTMTRSTFITWIVRTLFLEGNGNCVVYPSTRAGIIRDLIPIPATLVSFTPADNWSYKVIIGGKTYAPDRLIHFDLTPASY